MAISTTETSFPRQKRSLRLWMVILVLCMIPVGFVLFAYVATRFAGQMRLEQAFAEADRLDPGWRFDDLENQRSPYPASEKNGIDHALRVCAAMPKSAWPEWPFPKFASEKSYLVELRIAMDASLEGERLAPTLLNVEQERVIRAEVARAAVAIELARQMPNYPYGRYPVKWTKDYVSTLLPHAQEARSVALLLDYDARLKAHDDDLAGACHDVKAILYASRALGDEEVIISQLVRMAVDGVAVRVLEKVLANGCASEETLLDLQKEFEQEAKTPFFLTGLRGERACLNYLLENIQEGKVTFGEYHRLMTSSAGFAPVASRPPNAIMLQLNSMRMYLNIRGERAQVLHYLNELVELAKLPPWEALEAIEAKDMALIHDPPLWTILCANVSKICIAGVRVQAGLRCAYTALALERFQQAKGRWPDKLTELVPEYLTETPLDPFDGQPLRLVRKGHAVIVYSVGRDKEDNGGTLLPNSSAKGSDLGFVLQDPGQRRQPAKPFVFPERPTPTANGLAVSKP